MSSYTEQTDAGFTSPVYDRSRSPDPDASCSSTSIHDWAISTAAGEPIRPGVTSPAYRLLANTCGTIGIATRRAKHRSDLFDLYYHASPTFHRDQANTEILRSCSDTQLSLMLELSLLTYTRPGRKLRRVVSATNLDECIDEMNHSSRSEGRAIGQTAPTFVQLTGIDAAKVESTCDQCGSSIRHLDAASIVDHAKDRGVKPYYSRRRSLRGRLKTSLFGKGDTT